MSIWGKTDKFISVYQYHARFIEQTQPTGKCKRTCQCLKHMKRLQCICVSVSVFGFGAVWLHSAGDG